MSTYKKLLTSDVFRIPFYANKKFSLNSTQASDKGITSQTFEDITSSLHSFSSASTDILNTIKFRQINHLYYKDFNIDISDRFGEVEYLHHQRELNERINVLSIPSSIYGIEIKKGTFYFSGSGYEIMDDKKGNLLISGTQLVSHSIDLRDKIFHLGPTNGYKLYDLNTSFYGNKTIPKPHKYYNRENIYDDSYYINSLHYKNIKFSQKKLSNNTVVPQMDFSGNMIDYVNLVSNGTFKDVAYNTDVITLPGWSAYGGSAPDQRNIKGEQLVITRNNTNQGALLTVPTEIGKSYKLTLDVFEDLSANTIYIILGELMPT